MWTWVRDTVSPAAPVVSSPSASPLISANNSLSITGTCEANATVFLSGDASAQTTCASGSYFFDVTATSDGFYSYSITQRDLALNASVATVQQWQRDTSIPSSPFVTSPAASVTTNGAASLSLTGTCKSGRLGIVSGATAQEMACSSSAFAFTVSATTDGEYSFDVVQKNVLTGATSAPVTRSWRRDSVAPTAPTRTSPSSSPHTSGDSSLTLSGVCEAGANVTITGGGASTQTYSCNTGMYTFTLTQATDGTYTYGMNQTDLASNVSSSTSFTWTRDKTIPPTPAFSAPAMGTYYSNDNSIHLTVTCASGNVVILSGS